MTARTPDGAAGQEVPADGGDRGRGAAGVGLASLVAAGSGYLVILVAARVLTPAANADFLAFWGLLFFLFGTLGGLQSEVTRSTHVARTTPAPLSAGAPGEATAAPGPLVLPLALLVGTAMAVVVVATAPLWARAALGDAPWSSVAVVAVGLLAFAGHSAVAGSLAGQGRWTTYARVVGAEALVRLALALAVAAAATSEAVPLLLRVATGAAAGTWLLLSIGRGVRQAWGQRSDRPRSTFLASSGQAMAGAASSAALVVGFPVLLRVTTAPEAFALAAPLILAVQLTRAPLLIPLTAYQGMAITYVLTHRGRGAAPLLRIAGLVAGAGAVAAVAAGLLGPWLMTVILPAGYRVSGPVLAALTLSAALLALLTLTGAAALALDGHRAFALGWALASLTSAATLLIPGDLATRVVVSLAVGPLVGLAIHVAHVRRALLPRR